MRPSIGFAAIALLEAAGCRVEVRLGQTCCARAGFRRPCGRTPRRPTYCRVAGRCAGSKAARPVGPRRSGRSHSTPHTSIGRRCSTSARQDAR